MKVVLVALVSAWVLVEVGGSVVAAPGQGQRPGDISPPNVWVQNRGAGEAIPVEVIDTGSPVRVQLVGPAADAMPVRAARQQWEYQQIRVGANQDPVPLLNAAGAEGWEATGVTLPTTGAVVVVVKRPR